MVERVGIGVVAHRPDIGRSGDGDPSQHGRAGKRGRRDDRPVGAIPMLGKRRRTGGSHSPGIDRRPRINRGEAAASCGVAHACQPLSVQRSANVVVPLLPTAQPSLAESRLRSTSDAPVIERVDFHPLRS